MTVDSGEAERTRASVRIDVLGAGGSVLAGLRQAFVDIDFTILAAETVDTNASIRSDTVQTTSAVLTRDWKIRDEKLNTADPSRR